MRAYLEFKTISLWRWQILILEESAKHLHHIHYSSKQFCIIQINTNGRNTVGNRRRNWRYQQLPPSQQQQGIHHIKLQTVPQRRPGLILLWDEEDHNYLYEEREKGAPPPPAFRCWFPWATNPCKLHQQMEVLVLKEVQVQPPKSAEDRNQAIQEGGKHPLLAQSTSFLSCFPRWPLCLSCWRKLPCKTLLFCMRKHRWAETFSAKETQEHDRHTQQKWLQAGNIRMWATVIDHIFMRNNTIFPSFQWNCYHEAPRDFVTLFAADYYI